MSTDQKIIKNKGSLIVSQSAAHPTALLFAGSSTTTVGNPLLRCFRT
jgi:hypothetical protein